MGAVAWQGRESVSEAVTRRHAFAMKVLDSAHAAGLDGPDLRAGLINVLATMYASSAKGDAARYEVLVDETVSALRAFPDAPQRPTDPGQIVSDEELKAYEALVRAAIRWTKSPKAKVMSSFDLIMAELRRLRVKA